MPQYQQYTRFKKLISDPNFISDFNKLDRDQFVKKYKLKTYHWYYIKKNLLKQSQPPIPKKPQSPIPDQQPIQSLIPDQQPKEPEESELPEEETEIILNTKEEPKEADKITENYKAIIDNLEEGEEIENKNETKNEDRIEFEKLTNGVPEAIDNSILIPLNMPYTDDEKQYINDKTAIMLKKRLNVEDKDADVYNVLIAYISPIISRLPKFIKIRREQQKFVKEKEIAQKQLAKEVEIVKSKEEKREDKNDDEAMLQRLHQLNEKWSR